MSTSQPNTLAVHSGREIDPTTGAIVAPIHTATTFVQAEVGRDKGYTYTRSANPTVAALERNLAALEGAPSAAAFSSGLAALTTLFLATLKKGDRVVCSEVVYGGTFRLLTQVLAPLGVQTTFVDTTSVENLRTALRGGAQLVLVESPANPTLVLTDLAAASSAAHDAGALFAVDNTFLTPVGQRALELGADVSVHSTTKHVEGHNSAVGGALIARDEALVERFRFVRNATGTIQTPFNAWLTLRGLKTLPLRLERHAQNALEIARFLSDRAEVERVGYPGLPEFAQSEIARRQHRSDGGLIAFEVRGGASAARAFLGALKLAALAESLGSVETLATHPATMTHASIPAAERARLGIGDGLIRLSVGLEAPADLIADLDRALIAAREAAL